MTKRNVLTFTQQVDLANWLREQKAGRYTAEEAAQAAARKLPFLVTAANVRKVAGDIHHELRSGRKAARKPRKLKDTHTGLSVVSQILLEILPQLDVNVSADLLRDAERLANKKMRSDGSCPTVPATNQKTLQLESEAENYTPGTGPEDELTD